jgi:hypothetical protein
VKNITGAASSSGSGPFGKCIVNSNVGKGTQKREKNSGTSLGTKEERKKNGKMDFPPE